MNFSIQTIKVLLLTFLLIALASCEDKDSYITTKSGLKVKILKKGEGGKVILNGVAQLHLKYQTENGVVLFTTEDRGGPVPVRTSTDDRGLFAEVVNALSIGDSVTFEIPAENLYEKTYQVNLPDSIAKGSMLKFNLGLSNTMTLTVMEALRHEEEERRMAEIEKIEKEQLRTDIGAIDLYLEGNGINAVKLKSGIRYVLHKKGKGPKPVNGQMLKVHYVGKFFNNDEVFDQSDKEGEPFSFSLGSGVINGWSLGFAELREGSSATLYIPSPLAYGLTGFPGAIPSSSILVFDVELIEVVR